MACSGVIRVGDEVTSLEFLVIDCKSDGTTGIVDLTNATDITVRFKRQNKVEEDVVGAALGDPADGVVQYITPPDFITETDIGTLQGIAIVTFATSGPYHSSPGKFKVKGNF